MFGGLSLSDELEKKTAPLAGNLEMEIDAPRNATGHGFLTWIGNETTSK